MHALRLKFATHPHRLFCHELHEDAISVPRQRPRAASLSQPFITRNAGLPEQAPQKIHANIPVVRVGKDHRHLSPPHLRMPSTGKWAIEAQLT
jgi:hypothetical protein